MPTTSSGAYRLPTPFECWLGNHALRAASLLPMFLGERYVRRQRFYQTVGDTEDRESQGDSHKKWEAIASHCEIRGKTVLDIGCAEGFFCQAALKHQAALVVGTDCEFRSLLVAKILARRAGLNPYFVMATFPELGIGRRFDLVFCFSVLHHMVNCRMGEVLANPAQTANLDILRNGLCSLVKLLSPHGQCVIEIPYKYEEPGERQRLDRSLFTKELLKAGFASARECGTWEQTERNVERKDRVIYVAEVP